MSHRLSMLAGAQRILVLDQGEKVAFGTHRELLAQPGIYSQFWQQQMGGHDNG
ncbi:MAG: ABC transporter ATP-binding protein [Victivallales bacterium]|nr:ABC transporter ATP-binding protein [Victivallales bacterium]